MHLLPSLPQGGQHPWLGWWTQTQKVVGADGYFPGISHTYRKKRHQIRNDTIIRMEVSGLLNGAAILLTFTLQKVNCSNDLLTTKGRMGKKKKNKILFEFLILQCHRQGGQNAVTKLTAPL